MRIILIPQAAEEFDDATDYFDQQQAGLGHKFRDEVDRYIHWIAEHADIPRLRAGDYRRVNLKIFPYYIAYLAKGDTIWVLAIAHGHRKPEYWIRRRT